MEYIDKDKSRNKAHELIKSFLEEQEECSEDLYSTFQGDFRQRLKEMLLNDSDNRCCYCMRDLKATTLEHVIPRSVNNQEGFSKYFEIESKLDKENIILEREFLNNSGNVPPFPHTVAYENLIPSCSGHLASRGSKSCNNYRGDKFIQPLVFRQGIHNEIKYKINGFVEWTEEDLGTVFPTITSLGLNSLELKAIRRIWYYLSSKNLSCDESNKDKVINGIITELDDGDQMLEMLMNFKKTEYWKLLSQYTYFNNVELFVE